MALTEINSLGVKDAEVKTADLAADAVDGTKIADDSINSEHYVAASIDHEHLADDCVDGDNIADNSVGLAAMAGIVRGKIIYGDSSGNPAYLTVGSADQVLKSDGTDVSWGDASAGATGAGSDKVFWENGQTVTQNYTIGDSFGAAANAMSAGPITINNGVTVTINSGETWTIV